MTKLLEIKNIYTKVKDTDKEILKGLDLTINKGEIHVIMGPNGAGKSTLANTIFNNPEYEKTDGTIKFDGEDITDEKVNEIARKGIFMSFQSPEEIPGITVAHFLKTAKNAISDEKINLYNFSKEVEEYMNKLSIPTKYTTRDLNVGYSGGEKKKNEILQMLVLNPKLAILDETDSGLDVDAINIVSNGINLFKNDNNSIMIITHNNKILKNIHVDYVHILVDGKIIKTGDASLAEEIDKNGYKEIIEEYKLSHEN